jgi:hypothetical protein
VVLVLALRCAFVTGWVGPIAAFPQTENGPEASAVADRAIGNKKAP